MAALEQSGTTTSRDHGQKRRTEWPKKATVWTRKIGMISGVTITINRTPCQHAAIAAPTTSGDIQVAIKAVEAIQI